MSTIDTTLPRPAPRAVRTAISLRLRVIRTNNRFVTLMQAITNTKMEPASMARTRLVNSAPMYSSWNVAGPATIPVLVCGNSRSNRSEMAANSVSICSNVTSFFNLPKTSRRPLPRSIRFMSSRSGSQNRSAMGKPKPSGITPTTEYSADTSSVARMVRPTMLESPPYLLCQSP